MVIALPAAVRARLAAIEAAEGTPAIEVVHQAVAVFSHLDDQERKAIGFAAMQMIANRIRRPT